MKGITLELLERFGNGLAEKIDSIFVRKQQGKGLSSNDYTQKEKEKLEGIAAGANNYTHPESSVTAGIYKSVSVDSKGHVIAGSNPTTLLGYGITDAALQTHTHGNNEITGIDASKIASGTIDIERLPASALERLINVVDDTARFALTKANVQIGDTIKVKKTGMMYFVIDDTKLSTESGYEPYTVGSASSVPWSGVTGRPDTFKPSVHTHTVADITDLLEAETSDIDNIIAGLFV